MNRVEIIVVINNIAPVVRKLANAGNATDPGIVGQNQGRYAVDTNSPIIPDNVYRFPQVQIMNVNAQGLPGVGPPGATAGSTTPFIPLLPFVPTPARINPFTGRFQGHKSSSPLVYG